MRITSPTAAELCYRHKPLQQHTPDPNALPRLFQTHTVDNKPADQRRTGPTRLRIESRSSVLLRHGFRPAAWNNGHLRAHFRLLGASSVRRSSIPPDSDWHHAFSLPRLVLASYDLEFTGTFTVTRSTVSCWEGHPIIVRSDREVCSIRFYRNRRFRWHPHAS